MRALVTGAASGIGKALADALRARGDTVVGADLAPGDGLLALDVRDPAAWQRVLGEAGEIDVLYNIAGVLRPGWCHEATAEDVDRHVDVNVKGVIHGTRLAAAGMVARGRGHVVNVASLAGVAPIPGLALYSASKFAVRGYSIAVGEELRRHGVAVTVVCPDAVQTPMLDLQRDYAEAAMTFSGPRALSTEEVVRVLIRVLDTRPREVLLPASRGWLAKIGNAFPDLASVLAPALMKKGEAARRGGEGS